MGKRAGMLIQSAFVAASLVLLLGCDDGNSIGNAQPEERDRLPNDSVIIELLAAAIFINNADTIYEYGRTRMNPAEFERDTNGPRSVILVPYLDDVEYFREFARITGNFKCDPWNQYDSSASLFTYLDPRTNGINRVRCNEVFSDFQKQVWVSAEQRVSFYPGKGFIIRLGDDYQRIGQQKIYIYR